MTLIEFLNKGITCSIVEFGFICGNLDSLTVSIKLCEHQAVGGLYFRFCNHTMVVPLSFTGQLPYIASVGAVLISSPTHLYMINIQQFENTLINNS